MRQQVPLCASRFPLRLGVNNSNLFRVADKVLSVNEIKCVSTTKNCVETRFGIKA